MKRRTEISDRETYIKQRSEYERSSEDHSDFYKRWYEKFGEPETKTMRGDQFMNMLKEMIEFE